MDIPVPSIRPVQGEAAVRRITNIHRRFARHGSDLPLRLWDGTELGPGDADYRVVLHHPWSLRAMMIPGTDLATGEAYVFDAFDVEGSMVPAIAAVAALREEGDDLGLLDRLGVAKDIMRLPDPPPPGRWRRARLDGERHSKQRDAEAIRFHYDLGNDFYRLFLDQRLVYSCAYFAAGDDDLDNAQLRKLDLICRKLRLQPGDSLLDIGCGWGSLLLHAVEHYGVRALGMTLSEPQAALARERADRAGFGDRIEVRVQDYRDVAGSFDAVASIGMFEHVGMQRWDAYFDTCKRVLAPGGRFLNHHITTGRRDEVRDMSNEEDSFVAKYVFPDGALAPVWMAVRAMQRAGFEIADVEQLRRHYAETLRHWVARLESRAADARELAGEEAYRIWRAYMAASSVGFASGDLGVVQVLGTHGDADLPRGRGWMLPQRP